MDCPKCQHENREEARFCEQCATELQRHCQKCGHSVSATAKFCEACSHDLSEPTSPSDIPTKPVEPSAPTGERRQATVLFSDLSGYTTMNEKLDPEEVEGIMSRIKVEAVKIVEGHGGIVSQFVGDEVLALFGIPTAHEDDPRRAVKAALELHEFARTLSPEVEEKIGRPLRMHTGIHSGLIVTSLRDVRDGTVGVTGDTINTGARLKALAEDNSVLVSAETRRLIAPFFTTEMIEPMTVKGKAQPIIPFQVIGESGVASRFDAAEQKGFTPYTGREAELATLTGALERAKDGQGQFVTVSGEAGLGKSRLLHEFRHGLDREAYTVLQGRCQSFGGATPYLPLIDALARGLRLRDDLTPVELAERAVGNLLSIDTDLEAHLPVLLQLLSVTSVEHPLPEAMQGEALRLASQEALAAVFLAQPARQPTVLVLEDWHWADEASDSALRYMLGLIPAHRLLVVVNYRPEYESGWSGLEHHVHLAIAPLNANHSEIVAKAVLEAERLPEGLGELIHERTGGNPFFIEEMCQELLESGTLLVHDGQGALTRPAEKLDLPATVQAVIRTRLDRLDENHREVLRLASVIGREFGHRLLAQAHGAGDADLAPLLERMKAQGLIQQVRMPPDAAYQFKHVLTQVVVYETLLIERRKALHGLVGRAMEEFAAGRLEEHCEALAYHFGNSNEADEAIRYLELAGDKAARNFSLGEAKQQYWTAIDILDSIEPLPEQKIRRIDVALKWASAVFYSPPKGFTELLSTSRKYAIELGDKARLAQTQYWIGRLTYALGRTKQAMPYFEEALVLSEELGNRELLARSTTFVGRACFHTAEYARGIENLTRGLSIMEHSEDEEEIIYSNTILGAIHGFVGEFDQAFFLLNQSLEGSRAIRNPTREGLALGFLAIVKAVHGDWAEAARLGSAAAELSEKTGNMAILNMGRWTGGYATFMREDKIAGLELMADITEWPETGIPGGMAFFPAWHSEMFAATGARIEAIRLAKQAVEQRQTNGQRTGEAIGHRALALLAAQEKTIDWRQVDACMEKSLAVAEECGERPNLAIGHFRYAGLLHKKGDLGDAREQLDQAKALFSEMEMTWWLKQAEELGERLAAD